MMNDNIILLQDNTLFHPEYIPIVGTLTINLLILKSVLTLYFGCKKYTCSIFSKTELKSRLSLRFE